MRGYCIWCFALAILVSTPPQLAFVGRVDLLPGPRDWMKGPDLRPVEYCEVNSKITSFLKRPDRESVDKDIMGMLGDYSRIDSPSFMVSGRSGRERRHGESNKWLYNCLHVGLNADEGVFEMPVYKCCTKCEYPTFYQCIRNDKGKAAYSRCNSKAIRCIAGCLSREQPLVQHTERRPSKMENRKCPVEKKYIGGSYCLERSCIPV